eukprot:4886655-Ditylum_brightwellii.AAC.1
MGSVKEGGGEASEDGSIGDQFHYYLQVSQECQYTVIKGGGNNGYMQEIAGFKDHGCPYSVLEKLQ